jgi:predicted chitinase
MQFTVAQLHQIAPKADKLQLPTVIMILDDLLPNYNITRPEEIASFMAVLVIESNQFRRLREKLDLSAEEIRSKGFVDHVVKWRKLFSSVQQIDSFVHKPTELGEHLYGHIGGYDYRGAFYHRIYGKQAIEDFRAYVIEYEMMHPLPASIKVCRDLTLEEFCEHPLPNVLSVAHNWKRFNLHRYARSGKIEALLERTDYPEQVRKATHLIEEVVDMLVKSRSSSKV